MNFRVGTENIYCINLKDSDMDIGNHIGREINRNVLLTLYPWVIDGKSPM